VPHEAPPRGRSRRIALPRRVVHPGYDDRVTDSDPATATETPAPPTPGEQRRLAHPPSDRYRAAEARAATADTPRADPSASLVRGLAIAIAVGLVGAVALVLVGGLASVTTGLLVVAGAIGFCVALALQIGAGVRLATRRRIGLAIVLTVASIALGQLGIWQYARSEGGVLPLIDFLGEVYGPLVPAEFAVGALVAWVAAR